MRNWALITFLLIMLIAGILFRFIFLKPSPQKPTTPPSQKIPHSKRKHSVDYYVEKLGQDRITLLLLGVDITWTREHLPTTKHSRSDTIMVIRVDLPRKYVGILSIPRDLRILLPPPYNYHTKINACTALEGPHLLKRVLQDNLNIFVDNVIVVKQEAVIDLIDAMGGLEINVEKDMDYDDNWGRFHVHLKAGPQLLSGQQVIGYMRFRYDEEGDLGRIRRQQQVLRELVRQVPSKLKGLDIIKLVMRIRNNIRTDMDTKKITVLAEYFRDYANQIKLRTGTVPVIDEYIYENGVKISYLEIKDREEFWETVKYVLKGYPSVQLLNGTNINGLVRELYYSVFKDSQFAVTYIGNAPRDDVETTLILYGREEIAEEIAQLLGTGQMRTVDWYLYDRLQDTTSENYLNNAFLWNYLKNELKLRDYDVNVIVGYDLNSVLEESTENQSDTDR